jgi:hypothetical protein
MKTTTSWNKYGKPSSKTDRIASGLYIMANNGKIPNAGLPLTHLKIS